MIIFIYEQLFITSLIKKAINKKLNKLTPNRYANFVLLSLTKNAKLISILIVVILFFLWGIWDSSTCWLCIFVYMRDSEMSITLTVIVFVFDLFGSVGCAIEVLIGVACIVMETVILLINDQLSQTLLPVISHYTTKTRPLLSRYFLYLLWFFFFFF